MRQILYARFLEFGKLIYRIELSTLGLRLLLEAHDFGCFLLDANLAVKNEDVRANPAIHTGEYHVLMATTGFERRGAPIQHAGDPQIDEADDRRAPQ